MSTGAGTYIRLPSLSRERSPQTYQQQFPSQHRRRPPGEFVKQSKNGGVILRLAAQADNAILPVYGSGSSVDGTVELSKSKTESVTSVEVKIEGRLRLKEIAEGGTHTSKFCLNKAVLYSQDSQSLHCPCQLSFRLRLPTTFSDDGKDYSLPPTYDVQLDGIPGFQAWIDYSVTALVNKSNVYSNVNMFGIRIGNQGTVSTPFIYHPRTRPSAPLPLPMHRSPNPDVPGVLEVPEWRLFETKICSKSPSVPDIMTKFYMPSSMVFAISQAIPFHLVFHSSALSLAAFLPFGPPVCNHLPTKRHTRVQLLRQSTVDVRNAVILGTKTNIWRVDCVGEATFKRAFNRQTEGPEWMAFKGKIDIDRSVKVGGFKAAGLTVKDCIVLSITPPKGPFSELRYAVPMRLTTDAWV